MKFSTVKKALITAFAASANAYDLLKDYSGDLKVGVAANSMKFSNSNYVNAMKAFNMMVAENACKLSGIQQQKGNYNFNDCDAHYNKAKELGMEFRGHTLVWHAHMPQWFEGADANTLKSAIVDHVTKVLKHYEGKIKVWDVVNEAVDDSSNGNGFQLRNSFLRQKVPDFIDLAFKTAREVSPDTKLFYNDYNAEGQYPKSESIYNFVADLKKRNIPIDGVGLQYHVGANSQPAFDKINNLIGRYCKLGLEVHITELDVKLEGNQNGQTQAYSNALKACLANSCCKAFLVWGVGDSDSWLGGNEQALLFNNNYQPKPVYNTLLDILKKEAKPAAKEEPANSAAATTVIADTAAATTAADEKKTETKVNKSTTTKTIPASLLTKTQSKTKTIPESLLTKTQSKTKTIPSATTIPATKTLPTSKFTKTLPDTTKPKTLPNTTKTIPSAPLTNTTPKTESAVANTTRTTKTVPQSILDMIAAKTIPSSLLTKTKTKTIPESLLTKTGTKTIPSTLLTKTTPEASTTEVLTTTQVANEAAKTDATATTTAIDAAAATTAIGTTATVTGTDAAEATTKTEAATTDVTTIEPTTGATTKTTKTVPQSILDMIAAKSLGLTKTVTNTVSQTKTVPDTQCTSCAGNQNNLNIINNDNSTTNNNINNFNITNNNNTTNNINNNSTTNNISNNSTTNNITNTNNTSNVNNYYYIVYTTIDDGKAKTTSSIVSIPATDIPTASAGKPAPTVSVPVPEEIPSEAVIATKPVPSSIASKISSKACSKNKTKTNTVSATKSVPLTTTTKAVPEKTIINENDDTKTTTPKTDAPITATRTTKTVPQSILDKISKSCTKSKTNTVSTTKTLPVTTSVTEPAEGPIAEPTTEPVDEPIPEPIVETTTTIGGKITKTKKVTKTTTKTKPAADKCTCEPVTVTVTVTEKCASVETTAADAAVSDEAAKSTAPKTAEEVNPDDEEDNPERNPEAVSSNKCARRFARCGGLNYRGPKCCQSGSRCYYINRWISQCL